MAKEYGLAVFIGRFQPFHNEHLKVINQGLKIADKVLVLVGSASTARSIKNPFSFEERRGFVLDSCPENVIVGKIDDYFYSEETWLAAVQNQVEIMNFQSKPVVLLGSYKDASSYYLRSFPQWGESFTRGEQIDATSIREIIFRGRAQKEISQIAKLVPEGVMEWLHDFFFSSPEYEKLVKEFQFIKKYREAWKMAPYPPTFVTVDAVVIKSGHILLVRRGVEPGRGMLALPGGFMKQDETLITAATRELREETGLVVPPHIFKDNFYFDYPGRSLRGRTITHAFFWDLGIGELPLIRGSDDAMEACWVPLNQLQESVLYEDHYHIIQHFIAGNQRRK